MKEVYVDSAILETETPLNNYTTEYDAKAHTFKLMKQPYTRKDERKPFSVVASWYHTTFINRINIVKKCKNVATTAVTAATVVAAVKLATKQTKGTSDLLYNDQ